MCRPHRSAARTRSHPPAAPQRGQGDPLRKRGGSPRLPRNGHRASPAGGSRRTRGRLPSSLRPWCPGSCPVPPGERAEHRPLRRVQRTGLQALAASRRGRALPGRLPVGRARLGGGLRPALWWALALVSEPDSIRYAVLPGLDRDQVLADPELVASVVARPGGWWRPVRADPSVEERQRRRTPRLSPRQPEVLRDLSPRSEAAKTGRTALSQAVSAPAKLTSDVSTASPRRPGRAGTPSRGWCA